MTSPTVQRGSIEPYGSWKIICMSRRTRFLSARLRPSKLRPSKRISPPRRRIQLQHQSPQSRLAAARLPHQAEGLARLDRERKVVHRVYPTAAGKQTATRVEDLGHVQRFDQWTARRRRAAHEHVRRRCAAGAIGKRTRSIGSGSNACQHDTSRSLRRRAASTGACSRHCSLASEQRG